MRSLFVGLWRGTLRGAFRLPSFLLKEGMWWSIDSPCCHSLEFLMLKDIDDYIHYNASLNLLIRAQQSRKLGMVHHHSLNACMNTCFSVYINICILNALLSDFLRSSRTCSSLTSIPLINRPHQPQSERLERLRSRNGAPGWRTVRTLTPYARYR